MTEIKSIEELEEGDKVKVEGNGLDIESVVKEISYSKFKNKKQALLAPRDNLSIALTDKTHKFQNDGIQAYVGAVTVTKL